MSHISQCDWEQKKDVILIGTANTLPDMEDNSILFDKRYCSFSVCLQTLQYLPTDSSVRGIK